MHWRAGGSSARRATAVTRGAFEGTGSCQRSEWRGAPRGVERKRISVGVTSLAKFGNIGPS